MAKTKITRGFKGGKKRNHTPDSKVVEKEERGTDDLYDRVEKSLEEDGVTLFDGSNIEDDYLQLPAILTDESSRELGNYFNTFTKQKMYVRTLHGRAKAIVRGLQMELDEIRLDTYSTLPTKMSIKEKEIMLLENKKAKKLIDDIAFYTEKTNLLSDYLENLVDAIHNVSREITRRESDWNNEQRENSINNKRRR